MKKILRKIGVILILTTFPFFSLPTQSFALDIEKAVKPLWATVSTVITYAYDALGRLISQTQTVESAGVDLQGNKFESKSTINFAIKLGKAVLHSRITTTKTRHENGSWSRVTQTVWYISDKNGCLMGAWGKEDIEGRAEDYYIPKDKFIELGGKLDSDVVLDKNVGDKDLDKDGQIENNERNLIKVRGNTYSGTADLQFIIIDGEAYLSRREVKLTYFSSIASSITGKKQKQFDRHIVSTYKYAIKGGRVVMTDERTTTTDTYPQVYTYTDKDGNVHKTNTHLFQARYIHTKYTYDENGNLIGASGTGYGWGLVNMDGQGYMVYTSDITVTYKIINGQALQTEYKETAYYTSAQNAPDPIASPPPPAGDPYGTIIGMFKIRSSEVPERDSQGNRYANAGEYNEYIWLVVRVDLDDKGNPENPDGNPDNDKVYLVRVLTKAARTNWDRTTFDLSGYKVGDKIRFLGDSGPRVKLEIRDINGNLTTHRILRLTLIEPWKGVNK